MNLKIIETCSPGSGAKECTCMVVQIKHSSEKLNIAKLAFPLANPSMLRRFNFRWMEQIPNLNSGFSGYGYSITKNYEYKRYIPEIVEGAYIIPSFINSVEEVIEEWKL